MSTDERNFRSSYYEKVGFRSVEERKSLEILLKEKPLDKIKLSQFCLRFSVPGIYRNLVWKVLLAIIPIHMENHIFVMEQRKLQFHSLKNALIVMDIQNNKISKPELYVLIWLLDIGQLKLDWHSQIENPKYKCLCSISNSLANVFDEEVDIYWLSKGFFQFVDRFYKDIPKLIEYTNSLLSKEDEILYKYLLDIDALRVIPFQNWFCSCFAGVINEASLGKVWDKLTGGSCKILIFVAVLILNSLRRSLLKCKTSKEAIDYLNNINEEMSELIVNKATELWQQHGSMLTIATGADNIKGHGPLSRTK